MTKRALRRFFPNRLTRGAGALLLALAPLGLFAAAPPVIDSLVASSTVVLPGGTVTLTVTAHDPDCTSTCTTGCGLYIRSDLTGWTATGGTFPTRDNGTSASPYTASAVWQAPTTEGLYTVTVSLSDSGGMLCGGRLTTAQSLSIQVSSVINAAPVIDTLEASPSQLFLGETSLLAATAHDPDGDPLTWSWTATAGTVLPGAPGEATFQAAPTPGLVTVTLTVTDDKGAPATRATSISVTSAVPERELRSGLRVPQRVAADADGYLFVVDRSAGGLLVFNGASLEPAATLPIPEATSVAVDAQGRLVVGTTQGAQLRDRRGTLLSALQPGPGLTRVQDVAADAASGRIGVLYADVNRVVVFGADGTVAFQFGTTGTGEGQALTAVALACGPDGSWYLGDSSLGRVLVFDTAGQYVRSVGSRGDDAGEINQLGGLAVDAAGVLWVTDAFQSRMTAFNPDGTLRELLGSYGDGLGQLHTPLGVASLREYGKLVVASANSSSLQLFAGAGATTPQANRLPTVPTPIGPAEGTILPHGASVTLEVLNAADPDYQTLRYGFELYSDVGGVLSLLQAWELVEGAGTTAVDASAWTAGAGSYAWRVRAFDGIGYSSWSADSRFSVGTGRPNRAPGAALPTAPLSDEETSDLAPFLISENATDPENDALLYTYEAALLVAGGYQSVAASPRVVQGSPLTAWQVPAGALAPSQQVFWRVQATDTYNPGPWSDFGAASFWTPPFAIPEAGEYGNVPGGDDTRPGEVRYSLGPQSADVTLYFQLFDITSPTELLLEVNGRYNHALATQVAEAWSLTVSVTVPAYQLNAAGENRIRFVHSGLSDTWGIRSVSLLAPPVPHLRATAYNTVVDLAWTPRPGLPDGTVARLYRAYSASGPYVAIGDYPPGRALVRDTGLMNDTDYFYRACYVDPEGRVGEPSAVVSARPVGLLGPTPITDLKATRSGNDLVLTWTPVTSIPGVKHNEVYRGPHGAWAPDTETFTNLYSIEWPAVGTLRIPGGASGAEPIWYSVLPTDMDDRRATP